MRNNKPPDYIATFARIKTHFSSRKLNGLVCKQGSYKNCIVLKLQKAAWTNDAMDQIQNTSGIFFSVWMDQQDTRSHRANYNIHAFKLRELNGYKITSRDFATDFRKHFTAIQKHWPNVTVDHGPQTLMQGWIELDAGKCETQIRALMQRFMPLSPLIDRLLAARRIHGLKKR